MNNTPAEAPRTETKASWDLLKEFIDPTSLIVVRVLINSVVRGDPMLAIELAQDVRLRTARTPKQRFDRPGEQVLRSRRVVTRVNVVSSNLVLRVDYGKIIAVLVTQAEDYILDYLENNHGDTIRRNHEERQRGAPRRDDARHPRRNT